MRETLYIQLRQPLSETVDYAVVAADADASVFVRQAALTSLLTEPAAGRRIIVFVPALDVCLTSADIPLRQTAKALQAVPYRLEEQIAEDVEDLHFALAASADGSGYTVAYTAQARMETWLAPFRAAGVAPDAVIPEQTALPPPDADGTASGLADADRILVRLGYGSAFECAPDEFPLFIRLGVSDPPRLRLHVTDAATADLSTLTPPPELRAGHHGVLEALIRAYRPQHGLNLLQGRYSKRENLARLWRPWRQTAVLALLVALTLLTIDGVSAIRLRHRAEALETRNAQRFHQLFPDAPASLTLSLAIQQEAAQLTGGRRHHGLLALLQQLAQALLHNPGLKVGDLRFRDAALYVDLTGSDLQPLERLRNWFATRGKARLDVQSANANGKQVRIRIKLSAT